MNQTQANQLQMNVGVGNQPSAFNAPPFGNMPNIQSNDHPTPPQAQGLPAQGMQMTGFNANQQQQILNQRTFPPNQPPNLLSLNPRMQMPGQQPTMQSQNQINYNQQQRTSGNNMNLPPLYRTLPIQSNVSIRH